MSRGLICDNCGTALAVNDRGEDEAGESAAWVRISTESHHWDACTRACAHQLLDGAAGEVMDAQAEVIAGIARMIREDREADDE